MTRSMQLLQRLALLTALAMAAASLPRGASAAQVACESRNYQRALCPIDTRSEVRLARQLSDTRCVAGRSWGVVHGAVWVQSGCRAVFETTRRWGHAAGYDDGHHGGHGAALRVACESRDHRYRECALPTRHGVFLLRRLSDARCDYGHSWGTARGAVWVDRGCRAVFEAAHR